MILNPSSSITSENHIYVGVSKVTPKTGVTLDKVQQKIFQNVTISQSWVYIICDALTWYHKPGWLWTSTENSMFYFIISYCLSFSRLFLYILLRQYINIINEYNLLTCIICCLICFSSIFLKYTKICKFWGGQTFQNWWRKNNQISHQQV